MLKHQAINIDCAVKILLIILDQFPSKILQLWWTILENKIIEKKIPSLMVQSWSTALKLCWGYNGLPVLRASLSLATLWHSPMAQGTSVFTYSARGLLRGRQGSDWPTTQLAWLNKPRPYCYEQPQCWYVWMTRMGQFSNYIISFML